MEKKEITLMTPKEITEVGEAVRELMKQTAKEVDHGWSRWTSVPKILKRSFAEFIVAIKGMGSIREELKEDPVHAFLGIVNNVGFGVNDMIEILTEEKEVLKSNVVQETEPSEEVKRIMDLLG